MKTYLPIDNTMSLGDGTCHDFPRLARESGFTFNLYRGRVDWNKIGAIDIDRLIRERDLETLQDAVPSIMSCSLDNEYDLKVLDPNFVKLFRLAQLCVDYMQYCRRYLDHCVTVIQDQLRVALLEIEQLQRNQQQKDDDIKQLQKKLRGRFKSSSLPQSSMVPIFKCMTCMKVFVTEQYLQAHQLRRHPEISGCSSKSKGEEIENLQQQLQKLQERLVSTEEGLKQYQGMQAPDISEVNVSHLAGPKEPSSSSADMSPHETDVPKANSPICASAEVPKPAEENYQSKLDAQVQTSMDLFPDMMQSFEKIKADHQSDRTSWLECIQQQNEKIKALRDQLLAQHQAYEATLKKKLEELQHQHQTDLANLRSSLQKPPSGSGDCNAPSPSSASNLIKTAYSTFSQNTSHKFMAWDKQEDSVDAGFEKAADGFIHVNSPDPNVKPASVMNPLTETSPTVVFHQNQEQMSNEKHIQSGTEDVAFVEGESSSSSGLPASPHLDSRDANKKTDHLGRSEIRSMGKRISDLRASSSSSNGSKVENKTTETYNEPTSSTSSESISGSGTSSYDSETPPTSNEHEHQAKLKDIGSLSRSELNPQLLEGLKEDLQILVDKRLRELGVDPEWDRLPATSFRSNMATVKHHQTIAAKTHPSYFKIREAIVREVDRRVSQQTSEHHSPVGPSRKKKTQNGSSPSLLARLKSSVKNKLTPSGRSYLTLKQEKKSKNKMDKNTTVENVYSSEPSSVKPDSSHDYEVLSTSHIITAATNQNNSRDDQNNEECNLDDEQAKEEENSQISNTLIGKMQQSIIFAGTSVLSDSKAVDLSPSAKQTSLKTGKSFGRSMYANLDRSEMTLEKQETISSDSTNIHHTRSLQTSTPIKANFFSQEKCEKSQHMAKPSSSLIPSDIESISEIESDFNGHVDTHQQEKVSLPSGQQRTSRSTAELLADVAELRQNSASHSITRQTFKSNLKSSVSAGNIMKKKVVFRDEKDGFNTIELGPVQGSNSSIALQRSHSDSDLSVSLSTDPIVPVPLPRSSLGSSSTQQQVTRQSKRTTLDKWNSDSNKENDNVEITRRNGMISKHSSPDSNSTHVFNIVKDIERKLEQSKRRPLFGVNSSAPSPVLLSTSPNFSHSRNEDDLNNSHPSVSGMQNDKSTVDDLISELLLDDISSS